jgi:3',5'-cyclic AMP phosphodiesterase CpdA
MNQLNGRLLFSWLHLSDIHFGHGDEAHQWSQKGIVNNLLQDVRHLLDEEVVPVPQVILLTGDIAFKAAVHEYSNAEAWLLELIYAVGLKRRNVFTIAGNHDVQRTTPADRQAFRLVSALRRGDPLDTLDLALRDPVDQSIEHS